MKSSAEALRFPTPDNIALVVYATRPSLCHAPVKQVTVTSHHLLDHAQIGPMHIGGLCKT